VAGAAVGLLGLEAHTRRRNRANGRIRAVGASGFEVEVLQSFGNCPEYIHARRHEPIDQDAATEPGSEPACALGPLLDAPSLELLGRADTVFIASASAAHPGVARADGVDVSHRGGRPGFVAVERGTHGLRLTLPDYLGNFFFNTLGNLHANPRAGLTFVDFATADVLMLTGTTDVIWDGPELAAFAGAQRVVRFTVAEGVRLAGALPFRVRA
jgi:uncharacterized protein